MNTADVSLARLQWVLKNHTPQNLERYEQHFKRYRQDFINPQIFQHPRVHLEVGAGSGWMLLALAKRYPEISYVAIERDRMRAASLVRRAERAALANFVALRGNAIPAVIHGIPDQALERIYILYPCPFPKSSQRKHRWYLHPAMRHFVRVLKPGGHIIWASDQKFYIDEAEAICRGHYGLEVKHHGQLSPNRYNQLEDFPAGRTKFEHHFLSSGLPCYELIVEKRPA